jgi:hypothetical protein
MFFQFVPKEEEEEEAVTARCQRLNIDLIFA